MRDYHCGLCCYCLVVMSCLTLWDPGDLLPGSSIHGSSAYFGWGLGGVRGTHLRHRDEGLSPHLSHCVLSLRVIALCSKQAASGVEASAQGVGLDGMRHCLLSYTRFSARHLYKWPCHLLRHELVV